jgi:hypothetical protein
LLSFILSLHGKFWKYPVCFAENEMPSSPMLNQVLAPPVTLVPSLPNFSEPEDVLDQGVEIELEEGTFVCQFTTTNQGGVLRGPPIFN